MWWTRIPVLATSQAAFLAGCLIRCRFEDRRPESGAPAVMEVNPKGPTAEREGGVRTARHGERWSACNRLSRCTRLAGRGAASYARATIEPSAAGRARMGGEDEEMAVWGVWFHL